MKTYYIVVKGARSTTSHVEWPHGFYIVHAENLAYAVEMVRAKDKSGRIFVHDEKIMNEYKSAKWITLK